MATIQRPPLVEPVRRARKTPDWDHPPNLLCSNLNGKDTFFGGSGRPVFNADWTVQRRTRPTPDNFTFLQTLNLLAGKDVFFGGAGQPVFNPDWQIQKRLRRPIEFDHIRQFILDAAPNPFFPLDFPLPPRQRQGSERNTFLNALNLNLLNKDQFFGAAGQPLTPYDFSIARSTRRPSDSSFDHVRLSQLLDGLAAVPFIPYDWTTTSRKRRDQEFDYSRLSQLLDAIPMFAWVDQPVPRRARRPLDDLSFIQPVNLSLVGQDTFFGAPGQPLINVDFSIPRRTRQLIITDLYRPGLTLDFVQMPFFNQHDVTPRRRRQVIELLTYLQSVNLELLGKDKFFGVAGQPPTPYEWTVSKRQKTLMIDPSQFALAMNLPLGLSKIDVELAMMFVTYILLAMENVTNLAIDMQIVTNIADEEVTRD